MGLSSAMDTNINSYSIIYISVDFWITGGTAMWIILLIMIIVSVVIWSLCKVAGDCDKMEVKYDKKRDIPKD